MIGNNLLSFLETSDPEIYAILSKELNREENTLELIASENFASPSVMEMTGGVMTNKYAEGYPGKRYYGGCDYVDDAENLALGCFLTICIISKNFFIIGNNIR